MQIVKNYIVGNALDVISTNSRNLQGVDGTFLKDSEYRTYSHIDTNIKNLWNRYLYILNSVCKSSEKQINILSQVIETLNQLKYANKIGLDISSDENEIVFSRKSENGVSILVIDLEGDTMASFSAFKSEVGSRKFFDYNKFTQETVVLEFLRN